MGDRISLRRWRLYVITDEQLGRGRSHLGRQDLPASVVRGFLGPGKILGVSAETVEEAVRAEEEGADYLGVGPVFEARETKADAGEPLGLDLIAQVRLRCRLPIVASGGIRAENARKVREGGADGGAVVSAGGG